MDLEEKVLLGFVVVAAGYALYQSGNFTYWEGLLPRAAAVTTLALVIVVLAVHYFSLFESEGEALANRLEVEDEADEEEDAFGFGESPRRYTIPVLETELPFRLALGLLVVLYTVLALLLGLGPSSILFLLMYTRMADMGRNPTLGLLGATIVVLFVFGNYLETPLMDGWLLTVPFTGILA